MKDNYIPHKSIMPYRRVTSSTPAQNPVTHPILNILIQMKNNAKSDYSIKFIDKALTYLSKHADLSDAIRKNPVEISTAQILLLKMLTCLPYGRNLLARFITLLNVSNNRLSQLTVSHHLHALKH